VMILADTAAIKEANALSIVPLRYSSAIQPAIIINIAILAITALVFLSNIFAGLNSPTVYYCSVFCFGSLDLERTLTISFIEVTPAITFMSACSCR